MTKVTLLVVLAVSASWATLLLPWVQVGETSLSGAELSDILALLPAIAILILLISLYGRLMRLLQILASVVLGLSAYITLSTDFNESAASVALQESITGLVGESSLGNQLIAPTIFGLSQVVAALLCLSLLAIKPKSRYRAESEELDPRGLWESQS